MKAWRVVVIALSFLLLSGCLVSFKEPLPASDPAPKGLLGKWTSTNAWGEALNLELTRLGDNRYQGRQLLPGQARGAGGLSLHGVASWQPLVSVGEGAGAVRRAFHPRRF
ncbi:UNVERIFIED_ORG: hypothetical protein OKW15_003360 [Pseudomonas reinekei]|nr:hypothetical protein [Pseudomonas reinekei]